MVLARRAPSATVLQFLRTQLVVKPRVELGQRLKERALYCGVKDGLHEDIAHKTKGERAVWPQACSTFRQEPALVAGIVQRTKPRRGRSAAKGLRRDAIGFRRGFATAHPLHDVPADDWNTGSISDLSCFLSPSTNTGRTEVKQQTAVTGNHILATVPVPTQPRLRSLGVWHSRPELTLQSTSTVSFVKPGFPTPSGVRWYGSGKSRPWMQRLAYLAGSANRHNTSELGRVGDMQPGDLPGTPPLLGDSTGPLFGRLKAQPELMLRCTEFDENGRVVLVNGELKKSEITAKYDLQPRDLRKIDSSFLPSILVRPSSILVNLLHLRVLIQRNRVLVFDTWGSSNTYAQSVFMYDLEGKLGSEASRAQLPYEFRALEAVLVSVTSSLEAEYDGIRGPVGRVLRELEEDVDREKLRHLLVYSKKLGTFEQTARLVRDAIEDLLDEDEDLSAMYLTEAGTGKKRDTIDHAEIELLLESYHRVTDEIVQYSSNLVTNIRNTEEIIRAILDANRNALMLLDLKFSIGTLGIGTGALIAALFGMNLKNYIEESTTGFWSITGVSAALVLVVCGYGMHKLRRVQRLRMWGERASGGRGPSWRELNDASATAGRPGELRAARIQRLQQERAAALQTRKEAIESRWREKR